jgi:hypothetical protein
MSIIFVIVHKETSTKDTDLQRSYENGQVRNIEMTGFVIQPSKHL